MPSFHLELSLQFLVNLMTVVAINLILSGDNAVVIALAVKTLPRSVRTRALSAASVAVVVIITTATVFAIELLHVKFLELIGGVFVLWICLNLFLEPATQQGSATHFPSFWKAMWFVIIADVRMSTDNIVAVAAVAQGNIGLMVLGLGLSIPIVVFASGVLANLMDKYPIISYFGAAFLGRIAGEMIMRDAFIMHAFAPSALLRHTVGVFTAIGILVLGKWLRIRPAAQRRLAMRDQAHPMGDRTHGSMKRVSTS